jgi:hypothetical protein
MESEDKNAEKEKTNPGAAAPKEKLTLTLASPPPSEIVDSINIKISKAKNQPEIQTVKLSIPRRNFAAAQVGNLFFVAGGITADNSPSDVIDMFCVDPKTGMMRDVSDHTNIKLSVARYNLVPTVVNNRIFFVGGPGEIGDKGTIVEAFESEFDEIVNKGPIDLSAVSNPQKTDHRIRSKGSGKTKSHAFTPSSSATNFAKWALNHPERMESSKRGQIDVSRSLEGNLVIRYKGSDAKYKLEIEQAKQIFGGRVQNGVKIFNFFLQKLEQQGYQSTISFMLSELISPSTPIYANPDSAYKGLKNVVEAFAARQIEGTVYNREGSKRKETFYVKAPLVAQRAVSYNECEIDIPRIICETARYLTILPAWGYTLKEDAYNLLDYIYYIAAQNMDKIEKQGYFTIKLDTVRRRLGKLSPKEVKTKYKSDYKKFIIDPIDDAIEEIEETQKDGCLKITPTCDSNCKIDEWLKGSLEIEPDRIFRERMKQIAAEKKRKRIGNRYGQDERE